MWCRLALIVGLAACGGDAATPDAASFDATVPDATPDAWPRNCGGRRLVERPVTALALLDADPQITDGVVRIGATVDMRPCDIAAWVQAAYAFEAPSGTVTAYVFEELDENACKHATDDLVRQVIFSAYSAAEPWTFTSSDASLTVDVAPGPARACEPGRATCEKDCDCAGFDVGERCVGAVGGGTVCATPCDDTRECDGRTCNIPETVPFDPASPAFVCIDVPECDEVNDPACAPGFACEGTVCVADVTLDAATRHPCTCQADCDDGTWCVQSDLPDGIARCELLCNTYGDGVCPGDTICAGRGTDADELAETSSICVPFDKVPI